MTDLNELQQGLTAEKPKDRIKAIKQMGKTGDPAVIPALAQVYEMDDDDQVKAAAAQQLKNFAKQIPSTTPRWLRMVVSGLTVSLLILIVLNVLLRLGGGDAETSTPNAPTPRQELLVTYQTLLEQTKADLATMRAEWGLGAGNLSCNVTLTRPAEKPIKQLDKDAYGADFVFVDELNFSIFRLNNQIIIKWDQACNAGTRGTVEQALAVSEDLASIEATLAQVEAQFTETLNKPTPIPEATTEGG